MMAPCLSYRRVEPKVRCICGATLCGLSPAERCRVCNRLVLEAEWSRFANADARWLTILKHGCVWLTFGNMMMCVVAVSLMAACNVAETETPHWVLLLPNLALMLGAWMVATQSAGREERQNWRSVRVGLWIRLMVVAKMFFDLLPCFLPEIWDWCDEGYVVARHLNYCGDLCWIGLCIGLMIRAGQLADRMEMPVVKSLCMCAMTLAVLGTVTSQIHGLPYEFDPDGPWFQWAARCEREADAWPEACNAVSRGLLFGLALGFWGHINIALRRLEKRPGVIVARNVCRPGTVSQRSAWGKLSTEN